MAHLKLKDWHSAESDATIAINLDALHFKSYQRRSVARLSLGKVKAALKDLQIAKSTLKVLRIRQDTSEGGNQSDELPRDIDTYPIQNELLKIMKNAPRRRISIKVSKGSRACIERCNKSTFQREEQRNELIVTPSLKNTSKRNFKNWLEFEQVWNTLKSSKDKIELLQTSKPIKFVELYKNGMEDSSLFFDLIIHCSKLKRGSTMIRDISNIPSIDMLLMMLSREEKDTFSKCVEVVLRNEDDEMKIKRKFGLK